jgi:hypothetical protein
LAEQPPQSGFMSGGRHAAFRLARNSPIRSSARTIFAAEFA